MDQKLSIIYIRNPFDPHGSRDIAVMDWQPGASLADYMLDVIPAQEYALSLNGGKVELELRPSIFPVPGDQLVVCPVVEGGGGGSGKQILRIIAIIVVTIIAALVGQFYVGPLLASAWGAGAVATSMIVGATAALMGLGASMLMNALLPPPKVSLPTLGDGGSDSPTYGWNGVRTMAMQGVPIPVLYGTHRVGGNVISSKVISDGTNQYLDMLIALCEGSVIGIDDILVNNNPSGNFSNLQMYARVGEMTQDIIPFFGDISTEMYLNMRVVNEHWVVQNTVGNGVEGIEVDLTWPAGLFYMSGSNIIEQGLWVDIQYKSVGTSDAEYISFDGYPARMGAATREAYRVSARIDGLAPGAYTVRVHRDPVPISVYAVTDFYWTALREIVYDDMAYPGVALLGLRALATNTLSGTAPNVTALVTRGNVNVHDGTQWTTRSSDNPAWAAYDMLVNTQYGGRISPSRVDFPSFERWANFCDEQVPYGSEEQTERRITFNVVLDTSSSLWDAVNVACQVGRGAIIIRGTKYFAYYDAPGVPTQLFSVANIVPDSFKESYLPVKDRATELEIQYADKENNYERSSLNVMTDEGFAGTGLQQKTTISMLGCVTTTQAYREARYRLLMNQYLIRTISYDVGIDSLACEVGDLIYVQHDIPSWGLGGRIESATINTVTLDQSIVLEEGKSYRLMVRHTNDMLSQRTVVVPGGGYTGDTVTVTADFPHEPSQYDIYVFGEVDKDRKVFRLVSVRRSKDFDFTLTALEYDERVYAEQIAPTPPPPGDPYAVPPYVTEISTSYRWYADPTDPVVPPPVDPGTGGGNGGNGGTNDNADSTDGTGTGSQGGSGGDGSTGGDTGGDTGQ